MSSHAGIIDSDESFLVDFSSTGDIIILSPQTTNIHEIPMRDDVIIDTNSLDYVGNCAESKRHFNNIKKCRESLIVKFDPLYAKNLIGSIELGQRETESDVGYETSSSTSFITENMGALPKTMVSSGSVLTKSTRDELTQILPPGVGNDVQTKQCPTQLKSTPTLIRSVSATITPTQVTTPRLKNNSNIPSSQENYPSPCLKESDRVQSYKNIIHNQDLEILQLRRVNRVLKSSLQDLQHDFSRSQKEYELKITKLTEESDTLKVNECKLKQQISAKILSNEQMCTVMEEYEKTIATVIANQQEEKKQSQELVEKLTLERDQALNHLATMESSFNDLLSKYEKCKNIIMEMKEREKNLSEKISEYKVGMDKLREIYDNLKLVTSDNLQKANETLDNIKKNHHLDITKLDSIIKKHEITISSLQESHTQKSRDNEELTKICDQLLNAVS